VLNLSCAEKGLGKLRSHNPYHTLVLVVLLFWLVLSGIPLPATNPTTTNNTPMFLKDLENWIEQGNTQYGEYPSNQSFTAEVTIGAGEKLQDIQQALDAGYTCIYLKKQTFNTTKTITPPNEDFYVISNGATLQATEPMPAIFNLRNVRYAHLDGLFINGNGLADKCIDALRETSQVPCHQVRNCKIWGARTANVDFTGCEDSLLFNCWIDGRKQNDVADAITEYGVKIGEPDRDGYRTGGQINMVHCLMGFHRKADVYAKNIASLKLSNCLVSSKTQWSNDFEANIIAEGGTGENPLMPVLELANCWAETGPDSPAPNILVRNHAISKITIIGGTFLADHSPNIHSLLNPSAETITLVGALFENNPNYEGYNIAVATGNLVSVGCTYNGEGVDKANVAAFFIFDRDSGKVETGAELFP
jgi:hypothetical protein